jgi:hypothetical protein
MFRINLLCSHLCLLFQGKDEGKSTIASSESSGSATPDSEAAAVPAGGDLEEDVKQEEEYRHMERVIEREWKRILAEQLCWFCSKTEVG